MILDFSDVSQIKLQLTHHLGNSEHPEWMRDISKFIDWHYHSDSPLVQKTSGSTGNPKLITLSRELLRTSALATNSFFNLEANAQVLLCIPAKYIGGKMMILRAILAECKLIIVEPKIDLELKSINVQLDFAAMIPAQAQALVDKKSNLSSLFKCIIIGGAPISNELESRLGQLHDNCYSTYGMTETASHVALKHIGMSSDFKALDGIIFESNPDHRLIIKGNRIPNSPILTNDLVELTSNTSFKWRGRFDFVINSGGVKIIAEELEKYIATQIETPFYIKKVIHATLGESPVLVVKGEKWTTEKQKNFLTTLKQEIPDYWSPSGIEFIEDFTFSESGKLLRI